MAIGVHGHGEYPPELEAEAAGHGFAAPPRRGVSPTPDYVGSDVVVLEAV